MSMVKSVSKLTLLVALLSSQLEGLPLGNPCEASLMRWGIYRKRVVPQYEEKQKSPISSETHSVKNSQQAIEAPPQKKSISEEKTNPSNAVVPDNKPSEAEGKKSNPPASTQDNQLSHKKLDHNSTYTNQTEKIAPKQKIQKTPIPCFHHVWSFRVGYYGDFVSNRHMEIDRDVDASHLHQVKLTTHAAYLALNFWNLFDLFSTLGTTHISLYTPGKVFHPTGLLNNQFVRVESNTHFAWSAGIRGTLWQCGPLGLGASVQYAHARPHLNYFAVEGFDPVYFSSVHLNYHEWQIGAAAAYRFCIGYGMGCSPYLGIRWSHAEVHTTTPLIVVPPETRYTFFDLETSRDIGFSVGMTLIGCSQASLTLEGRFIDETAVYFNSQFRF